MESSSWLTTAIDAACDKKSELWNTLLSQICQDSNEIIQSKYGHQRFSKLPIQEQAAIIEGQFFEMQQMRSPILYQFASELNSSIDESLLENLSQLRRGKDTRHLKFQQFHTCVTDLNAITATAVGDILASAAPEISSTAKLFLNRPIPISLRATVWRSALIPGQSAGQFSPAHLPPVLHVALSRRCQALIDKNVQSNTIQFPVTASFVKLIIAAAVKQLNITTAITADSVSRDVDTLFHILIPLMTVFLSNNEDTKLMTSDETRVDVGSLLCRYLCELVRSAKLLALIPRDAIIISGSNAGEIATLPKQVASHMKLSSTPFLANALSLLQLKHQGLHSHIATLKLSLQSLTKIAAASSMSPTRADTESTDPAKRENMDEILSQVRNFPDILSMMLERGLVGWLATDCLLFVWDQGFIVGFDSFLPLVVVSLLLGIQNELLGLTELSSAYGYWKTFCSNMNILTLRRLLSQNCESELMNLFDVPGGYSLKKAIFTDDPDNSDVLQAVYDKWQRNSALH